MLICWTSPASGTSATASARVPDGRASMIDARAGTAVSSATKHRRRAAPGRNSIPPNWSSRLLRGASSPMTSPALADAANVAAGPERLVDDEVDDQVPAVALALHRARRVGPHVTPVRVGQGQPVGVPGLGREPVERQRVPRGREHELDALVVGRPLGAKLVEPLATEGDADEGWPEPLDRPDLGGEQEVRLHARDGHDAPPFVRLAGPTKGIPLKASVARSAAGAGNTANEARMRGKVGLPDRQQVRHTLLGLPYGQSGFRRWRRSSPKGHRQA